MSPTISRGQSGRAYRYYVSTALLQGRSHSDDRIIRRLSAPAIERVLGQAVERWLGICEQPLKAIRSVRLVEDGLIVELAASVVADLTLRLPAAERILHQGKGVSHSIYRMRFRFVAAGGLSPLAQGVAPIPIRRSLAR